MAEPGEMPEGPPSVAQRFLGPYAVLRGNRTLAILFGAGSLSAVIDWLYVVSLFVLAYGLTHSATIVALLTFTRLLPYALLVPLSGAITDRVDRRTLMLGATAGRTLCLFWAGQTATPGSSLGSVFGALESGLMFSMVIGSLVIGPLINAAGARAADVLIAGAGFLLLVMSLGMLRRLERVLGVRIFLRQVPILTVVPFALLDDLAARFALERFPNGTAIVTEGEVGDRFYIIQHGTVAVLVHGIDGAEIRINTRGTRDYFGEIALVRDVPRTATIRALGTVALYSLSRVDFQELLRASEALDRTVKADSDARVQAVQSSLLTWK